MRRDEHAFGEYVLASRTGLVRAAVLLVGDRGAAEDLVQDVYARLYVAWPRVDQPDAYAHRSLVNAAASRWRRPGRRLEVLTDRPGDLAAAPAADEATVARDEVVSALQTLPPRMRAVLVLRFLMDRSEAQTAELLHCSVGSVKSQTSRGISRLRQQLPGALTAPADTDTTTHTTTDTDSTRSAP